MAREARAEAPISATALQEKFVDAWASGDLSVDAEVEAAVVDKSETFRATDDVPTLKKLKDAACFAPPADLGDKIVKESIEADSFNLLIRTLTWDMQAHDVWAKKCAGVENSNAWAKQDAKLTLKKTSTAAVQRYVNGVVKLMVHATTEDTIR